MAEISACADAHTSAETDRAPVAEEGLVLSHGASEVPLDGPKASPAIRRKAHELDLSLAEVQGTGQHGRITLDDLHAATQTPAAPAPEAPPAPDDRIRISPFARRLAAERGIDISGLRGTGPAGAIQASDLRQAKPRRAATPGSTAARMQRAIAAAMTRANDEIPHYYVEHSIDMGRAHSWLRERNASLGVGERLVSGVLVLRAVARAEEAQSTECDLGRRQSGPERRHPRRPRRLASRRGTRRAGTSEHGRRNRRRADGPHDRSRRTRARRNPSKLRDDLRNDHADLTR